VQRVNPREITLKPGIAFCFRQFYFGASGRDLPRRFDEAGLVHDRAASNRITRWAYAQVAEQGPYTRVRMTVGVCGRKKKQRPTRWPASHPPPEGEGGVSQSKWYRDLPG